MVRVLVVEDDAETAEEILAEFSCAGMETRHEVTGRAGLASAQTGGFDVITLDRMLPEMDGLTVLDKLRGAGVQTPVLVLSALSSVDERIRGLRAGGDDYLTKPFSAAELRARVEALARRIPDTRVTNLRVEDLVIDLLAREARRGGRLLDLFPREFQLLDFLMRHAGHVVTRAMVFEKVWGYSFDPGSNLVDVHIGRLRRKVDGAGDAPLIHTVRGVGFVLRAQE